MFQSAGGGADEGPEGGDQFLEMECSPGVDRGRGGERRRASVGGGWGEGM